MNASNKNPSGMLEFTVIWAGQIVSVLASSMTQFALTIWVYQETGNAAALGVINTAFMASILFLSPIAGVMVDRYNRKLMMMVSDLIATAATAGIFILHYQGKLQIWHLYIAAVVNGLGTAFQWPAYSAAISTMVPKENYSRANGMISLIESAPRVLAPILAGILLPIITLKGILGIDVVTFLIAIVSLALVHVPRPARTQAGREGQGSILHEVAYGFKYIFVRRGLLGLLIFFICLNFIIGLSITLVAPFILSRTGNESATLGVIQSAMAIGAVVGGLLISLWGGFKRRMTSIFIGEALTGLFLLLILDWHNPFPSGSLRRFWVESFPFLQTVQVRQYGRQRLPPMCRDASSLLGGRLRGALTQSRLSLRVY